MGRYYSYINTAIKILQSYNGEMPFSIFIKQFFSKEKKYGSKDRKQIAAICYSYFRVGLALGKIISPENLLTAFFLVNDEPTPLIKELKPEWDASAAAPINEKIQLVENAFNTAAIFPFANELNNETDIDLLRQSLLLQPSLFVRLRPKFKEIAINKINAAGVKKHLLNNGTCVELAPNTNVQNFLVVDKEAVIQDYNSQQVLDFILNNKETFTAKQNSVWDCCAASGGKSILIYDLLDGKLELSVSDIRQSILANLQQRFKIAGINRYQHFVNDVSKTEHNNPSSSHDIIICDAPCTGSGTWSRTPEQLYFFKESTVDEFAEKQKNIASSALHHLKKDGFFFYITCSVFKKENEDIAAHISKHEGMKLIEMKNLFGFQQKADSMFVAVFQKIS
jgi:16S rRNA (cytosine967-C5)-methyltransferase